MTCFLFFFGKSREWTGRHVSYSKKKILTYFIRLKKTIFFLILKMSLIKLNVYLL